MVNNKYLKIFIILISSFFVSEFLSKNIFIAYSPKIRNNISYYLINKYLDKFNNFNKYITNYNEKDNFIFKKITSGVYAKVDEDNKKVKIELRLNEVKWKKQSIIIDGKRCNVNFVEGVKLPEKLLEKICKSE